MGYLSDTRSISVHEFLGRRFPAMSDGGYPGLVFLLARTADNPALHERFFAEWTDMHDVTRRFLAVITPAPRDVILEHRNPWNGIEHTVRLTGAECLGNTQRLTEPVWNARSAVAMGMRPANDLVLAPTLPGKSQWYHTALTVAAGEMRTFFGVSEALLPCAIFVSIVEHRAFVVALEDTPSLYPLLKRIRIELEPVLTEIDMAEAELAEAKVVRASHQTHVGLLQSKARIIDGQWRDQLARLARDLIELVAGMAGPDAERCRNVAADLASGQELTAEQRASARALAHTLSTARIPGGVPRRLRRAVAKWDAGYPDTHDVAVRMAQAIGEKDAHQRTIARLKARIDDRGRELRLGAALVAAANEFGLTSAGAQGLLPWRKLAWPIEVLARREPNPRQSGVDRATTITANGLHGNFTGNVVQANTISGGVHFHLHSREDCEPTDGQSPADI